MMNSWPEKEHFMNLPNQPESSDTGCRLEETSSFLRQQPVFRETPVDVLRLYAYLSRKEHYSGGETIIAQGRPSDRMYLIMKGQVSICEERKGRDFFLQKNPPSSFQLKLIVTATAFLNCKISVKILLNSKILSNNETQYYSSYS